MSTQALLLLRLRLRQWSRLLLYAPYDRQCLCDGHGLACVPAPPVSHPASCCPHPLTVTLLLLLLLLLLCATIEPRHAAALGSVQRPRRDRANARYSRC